jgi:hypothetical protein
VPNPHDTAVLPRDPFVSLTAPECDRGHRAKPAGCTDERYALDQIAKMTEGQGRDMTTFASSCIRCSDQPARSGNRHPGGITAHVSVMYVQYVDRHVMCLPFVSRHCDPWVSQKSLKTPRLCKQSCTDFRARIAKNRANPMRSRSLDLLASVFEELRKPQQRLLRLVDRQVFHSLQQVRRDVLVEELPCRASVSDRLFRFDCHGRWRNRAWSRCACSGRRCGCYCDWRRRCGVLSPERCVFGRLSWRHSVCESRLYCAESGLQGAVSSCFATRALVAVPQVQTPPSSQHPD